MATVSSPDRALESPRATQRGIGLRLLIWFFVLTFAVGWGAGIIMVLFNEQVEALFGPITYTNPVFILVVYSPAIAGIALVLRHYGWRGFGSYLRRLTLWRMPVAWWVFLIFGIPAVSYIAAALKGPITDPFPFSPWYSVFPALAITLVIGPIEEFGWRGVALPLLQRRFAPLWSSLILGAVWGVWHLPSFFLSGTPQSSWSVGPFLVSVLALSVVVSAMFNAARGSILIAALIHFQVNGPVWPDAQPWDSVVWVAVAVVVLLLNRDRMLSREGAVTEILYPGDEDRELASRPVAA
jgi:membrane protease YdiL (CAAX protease family)